jgi:tRNA(fMet)-specific endonuclease VapC
MKTDTVSRLVFLDTNIVSKSIRKPLALLEKRMEAEWQEGTRFLLPIVVFHEIELSVLRSESPINARARVEKFLSGISGITKFEPEDAIMAAEIRAELLSRGQAIGGYDTFIAAQALRLKLPLITNNVAEFSRVPGLLWEDWTL